MPKIKCLFPFTSLEIGKEGVFPCCPSWIKMGPLGDVRRESIDEIWNGERFQHLRNKMYRGEFAETCSETNCPFLLSGSMIELDGLDRDKVFLSDAVWDDIRNGRTRLSAGPSRVTLSDSGACNLKCIMCGSGRNYRGEDKDVSMRTMEEVEKILPGLRQIRLTGDGDPFFRKDTREFLERFDPARYPNLEFILLTNGIMLNRKMWDRIKHNNIGEIWVSIDAAAKETYEKIRVGGRWETLMENLRLISEIRKSGRIRMFEINMTVMRSNYKEIVDFVRLGESLGCDQVALQRFYGDTPVGENVFEPPDPGPIRDIQRMLKDPVFSHARVWREGLADVERYQRSVVDRARYGAHRLSVDARKALDRHILWRFARQPKPEETRVQG